MKVDVTVGSRVDVADGTLVDMVVEVEIGVLAEQAEDKVNNIESPTEVRKRCILNPFHQITNATGYLIHFM